MNGSDAPDPVKLNEDIFLQILKKSKSTTPVPIKFYKKNKIYSNMRILSTTHLTIPAKKYYKFPFVHINNYTETMHREWLIAIKNAFYNFLCYDKSFNVLFVDSVLMFRKGYVKCDCKLVDTLDKEDIGYVRRGEYLYIKELDVKLLFDFVINYGYMKTLPFILSRHRFYNSIYYVNVVKELGAVKNQGKVQYHYNVSGYFFVNDYRELFVHDLVFD